MSESADRDLDLWLRYADWSATQINKRLLELSVDELWAIANERVSEPTAQATVIPADLLPSQTSPIELLQLVRKATLYIAHDLALPTFVEWKQAYAEHPEIFTPEISGI